MPGQPLFSVVIPTYNRAGMLAEALDSVWAQRRDDYEVVVVDDGSTDDTAALLNANTARLSWYRQDHRGPAAARNLGAHHARGEYLAFLDSDDLWFPWTLDAYAEAIASYSKPALVLGAAVNFRDRAELETVQQAPLHALHFADYFSSEDEWRCWGAGFAVVRRDAFDAAGGFAEQLVNGEDADLVMRLGAAPGFVQVLAPATFGYRTHANSAMADVDQTLRGAWHLLRTENAHGYPGGEERAAARRRILGRHLRSLMLAAAGSGRHAEAWRMYRATFMWHVGLRRWRFLFAFPLMAARRGHRA
jgi:glycosyltransferase involved in cell wall biosynthesis